MEINSLLTVLQRKRQSNYSVLNITTIPGESAEQDDYVALKKAVWQNGVAAGVEAG